MMTFFSQVFSRRAARSAAPAPFPRQGQVEAAETLVDVFALTDEALVLNNGAFVRMLEVKGHDLERGDRDAKQALWARFAATLRRLRAPLQMQIVIAPRPQAIDRYLAHWERQAREWQALASVNDLGVQGRRRRLQRACLETAAFLSALYEQTAPTGHRYLVVMTHNPFPETVTAKSPAQVLAPEVIVDAQARLAEALQLIRAALSETGCATIDLNPAEMCAALWEHYHRERRTPGCLPVEVRQVLGDDAAVVSTATLSQCPTAQAFLEAAQDAERLADLLAPALIEEHEHYVRVGEAVARGYVIHDFDSRAPVDLASILALPADVTHALYLTAADPVVIRQQFKEKETELRAAMLVDARRGAVTDWRKQAAVQSLEQARAEMETVLQAPYFLHWYAVVWADDVAALEKKCQALETLLKLRDIRFNPATRRQVSVLQAVRPLVRQDYKFKPRNMSADSLGPFLPFIRREYFDASGWHFGLHRGNGSMVNINPFGEGQHSASQLVIGAPGGGKSVYLKQTVETVLALGHRVFVIDPEREYLRLAVDLHAPYIELGRQATRPRLAIDADEPAGFQAGLVEVCDLCHALAAEPLTASQIEALTRAYQSVMAAKGILPADRTTWSKPTPKLMELVAALADRHEAEAREIARLLAYVGALTGGNTINLLDLNLGSETPWQDAVELLWAFMQAIAEVSREPMTAGAFAALAEAYQSTLAAHGWVFGDDGLPIQTGGSPTLSALHATLAGRGDAASVGLAQLLGPYARGLYAGQFNRPTNVDLRSSPLVVFGMKAMREKLDERLADVVAWQVLRLVWNEIASSGAVQPIHVFVDEAWYWLKRPGAAARLEQMLRSFRKYNAALHLATQHVAEFAVVPEARAITDLVRLKLLFRQESEGALRALAALFNLTSAEEADLRQVRSGEGLLLVDHNVRVPLYVAVNPLRLSRLSTDREQQQAVARASGRRAQPVR